MNEAVAKIGFELRSDIDVEKHRYELATIGITQIPDVLSAETADRLYDVLREETEWRLMHNGTTDGSTHVRTIAEFQSLPESEKKKIEALLMRKAREGFLSMVYFVYPMMKAYALKWRPGHPLDQFLEWLNSPVMIDFGRRLSGMDEINHMEAHASCLAPGHFLTMHDDEGLGRRVAYTIGMTRDWDPAWGGQLNFLDDDLEIIKSYRPRFNSMNLFTIPRKHAVTPIALFAGGSRYSFAGWFKQLKNPSIEVWNSA